MTHRPTGPKSRPHRTGSIADFHQLGCAGRGRLSGDRITGPTGYQTAPPSRVHYGADMATSSTRSRRITSLALTVALAVPMAITASPAAAAAESVTFTIAGSIAVGPPPALTLPEGSTISFDHDPATGAITNAIATIPTFDRGPEVTGPQANITLTNATPGTGSWDRTSGAGSLELSLDGSIEVPDLSATCDLAAPIVLSLSTANAGGQPVVAPSPGAPATGVVTASGFTVPATSPVVATGNVTPATAVCPAVDEFLGLPTSDTTASLTVTEVLTPGPSPTPTPEPTPEPAPAPAPARPTFTG